MGLVDRDDGLRIPDWPWERIEPLPPDRPPHPLGCHNPRVPDPDAMDAILLVPRTGMQGSALNATGICSGLLGPPPLGGSGKGRACSMSSGARGCWNTMRWWASTGTGWLATGP